MNKNLIGKALAFLILSALVFMFYFNGSSAKLISEQDGLKIFSKSQENTAICVEALNKLIIAQKQNKLPPMRVMLHKSHTLVKTLMHDAEFRLEEAESVFYVLFSRKMVLLKHKDEYSAFEIPAMYLPEESCNF